MNKIVREHYPVANLPEDLRAELAGLETVTLVIESADGKVAERQDIWTTPIGQLRPRTPAEIKADFENYLASAPRSVSVEEAVVRVRELRDEWDDE